MAALKCTMDIVDGTDCPRPVVWRWFPYGRNGESAYLCDEHSADKDLSDLWDLIGSPFLAGETFTEDAVTQWRRESGTDPITGELA